MHYFYSLFLCLSFFLAAGLRNVNVTNGGFAACSSSYFSSCLNLHLPLDADAVIVELAVNDLSAYREDMLGKAAFERLIRRILNRPSRPPILLLNVHQHAENHPPSEQVSLYLHNAEAFFFDVATYYGLQLASGKSATWRLSQQNVPGFWINGSWFNSIFDVKTQAANPNPPSEKVLSNFLFWDHHHFGSINGHRALTELLIEIIVHASKQLLNEPEIDEAVVSEALPPPIFEGNFAPRSETCLLGDSLKNAALSERPGFNWTNEQRDPKKPPKWGWTGFGGGAELKLNISTNIGHSIQSPNQPMDAQKKPPDLVSLSIGFLTSYDPIMAEFEVTCVAGCICDRNVLNGLDGSRQVSQLSMKKIMVSQSELCIVSIRVIGAPAAPDCKERCKAKIGAIVLEEGTFSDVDAGKIELINDVFVGGVLRSDFGNRIKDPNSQTK